MISISGLAKIRHRMKQARLPIKLSNSMIVSQIFSLTGSVEIAHTNPIKDLDGVPVQYREVQGSESSRFLSYFPLNFTCLRGGVSTGFHHVSTPPLLDLHRLYRITLTRLPNGRSNLQVREVPANKDSLIEGDVFVLDKGSAIWQYNTLGSAGQEKFKAAEFLNNLVNGRQGRGDITVYGIFILRNHIATT